MTRKKKSDEDKDLFDQELENSENEKVPADAHEDLDDKKADKAPARPAEDAPTQEHKQKVEHLKKLDDAEKVEYYGTKHVKAIPGEKDGEKGFWVEYDDGDVSFSPEKAFLDAYKPIDALDTSGALKALLNGATVTRSGWGDGAKLKANHDGTTIEHSKVAQDGVLEVNSNPNITVNDLLATDWRITDEPTAKEVRKV